jgi:hypothetical protein
MTDFAGGFGRQFFVRARFKNLAKPAGALL